jgi:hypothetical protein
MKGVTASDPPSLRRLVWEATRMGYEIPDTEIGFYTAENGERVQAVWMTLSGHPSRRDVQGVKAVTPRDVLREPNEKRRVRWAARCALQEALRMAGSEEAKRS